MSSAPPSAEAWATALDNAGLVHHALKGRARQLQAASEYDDALQDGLLGLARAANRYDSTRGTLSTYAMPFIRHEVDRGRGRREGINYRRAYISGGQGDGIPPAVAVSIDAALAGTDGATVADMLAATDDPAAEVVDRLEQSTVAATARAVARSPLERDVAAHLLGVDRRTTTEIAAAHDVNRRGANQAAAAIRSRVGHPAAGLRSEPWAELRACVDADVLDFFPEPGASPAAAGAVCAECPVRADCSALAARLTATRGVWGGQNAGGQGAAAQLTPEEEAAHAERRARLELVAETYRAALDAGADPDQAAAAALDRSTAVARKRIRQARAAGLLTDLDAPTAVSRSRRPPAARQVDVVVEDMADDRAADAEAFDGLMAELDGLLV